MWALAVALIIALASAVALRRHAEAPQRAGEEYLAALAAGDRETLRALGAWSPGDSSTLLLDREGTVPTTGLLEELRVSLFAQQLGTARTVSDKRIRTAIAGLEA